MSNAIDERVKDAQGAVGELLPQGQFLKSFETRERLEARRRREAEAMDEVNDGGDGNVAQFSNDA